MLLLNQTDNKCRYLFAVDFALAKYESEDITKFELVMWLKRSAIHYQNIHSEDSQEWARRQDLWDFWDPGPLRQWEEGSVPEN